MKISMKLFLGFFAVIITFTSGLGFMYLQLAGIKENVDEMNRRAERSFQVSEIYSLHRARVLLFEEYVLYQEPKSLEEYKDRSSKIEEMLKQIESKMKTEEQRKLYSAITEANKMINETVLTQIVPAVDAGNMDLASQYDRTVIAAQRSIIRDSISALVETVEMEKQQAIDEAKDKMASSITALFIVIILSILLGIVIALFIARIITKPIKAIQEVSIRIAEGDLTVDKVKVTSKDEVGQLTIAINTMIDNIKSLIKETAMLSQQVAASSEELTASANEISTGIEQVSATTEELASGASTLAEHANNTMDKIQQVSKEIEQINQNANQLGESSHKADLASKNGTDSVKKSMEQMTRIQGNVSSTANIIQGLGEKSKEINQILQVINDIASQTNLLALNAAIEAARAGEQGRGFAVVADEVRKLAEQAEKSTNQISGIVLAVQKEAEESGAAMNHVVQEVQAGTEAMEKNGEAFKEIAEIIDEMNQKIKEVTEAAKQINNSMGMAVESVENIAGISEESSAGTEELAASMEQQNASMQEINGMAASLAKVAENLEEAMAKFKL